MNAGKPNGLAGGGDSDEEDEESDNGSIGPSKGGASNKRRFAGTKSRPARKLDNAAEAVRAVCLSQDGN